MAKRKDSAQQSGAEQEEYQYAGDEFEESLIPEEELPVKEPKPGLKGILRNRKVLTLLGIIIMVFVVYQFLERKEVAVPEEALDQKAQQPLVTAQSNKEDDRINMPIAAPPAEGLQTQIETLARITQQNQAQVQQLQANLQQTQASLVQMSRQLDELVNKVQNLAQKPVAVSTAKKSSAKRVPKAVAKPVYTLRAIVPGRAWLVSSQAGNLSVKVGDKIPGYGQIRSIDPTQGMILTSSGHIIRYGEHDS